MHQTEVVERACSEKKKIDKFCKIHRIALVLESVLNRVVSSRCAVLLKRDSSTDV